ncbi:MAG: hypothetical protein ACLSA6_17745 [Holdemania massiliensis]
MRCTVKLNKEAYWRWLGCVGVDESTTCSAAGLCLLSCSGSRGGSLRRPSLSESEGDWDWGST